MLNTSSTLTCTKDIFALYQHYCTIKKGVRHVVEKCPQLPLPTTKELARSSNDPSLVRIVN
jgi:hypothetical protein